MHSGIRNFRNIFLYFSMAYLFRLFTLLTMHSRELFLFDAGLHLRGVNFFLMGYFSTLGLLSIALTLMSHNSKIKHIDFKINAIALFTSFISIITFSPEIIGLVQLITMLIASFILIKKSESKLLTNNRATYISLLLLWVINLYLFNGFVWIGYKIPLYAFSIIIFYSILKRVNKRLSDGKKKR